jgi:hypothetical protein
LSRDLEIAKVRLSDDSLLYPLDSTDLQLLDKEEQHVGDHEHFMSELEDQGVKLNEEVRYYCQLLAFSPSSTIELTAKPIA